MNTTQQKSQIAKKIFEKVDEYRDWTVKVEKLEVDYAQMNTQLDRIINEYTKLDDNYIKHREQLDVEISLIKDELESLRKEEDDKIQSIRKLEVKLSKKEQEFKDFSNKIEILKKDLTDKIKGIENELIVAEENKEIKMKELRKIQSDARLSAISLELVNEELQKNKNTLLEMKQHIADIERREKDVTTRELRLQRFKNQLLK